MLSRQFDEKISKAIQSYELKSADVFLILHHATSTRASPSAKDIVGGRFDATQAFVGELSQFNMWDRVLRPMDIVGLANCSAYMPGNVVPWIDANVEVFGGATKAPLEICEDRAFDS